MGERQDPIPLTRTSRPMLLTRPAAIRDEWFDREPVVSVPPETGRVAAISMPSKGRAVLAGLAVGAVAGAVTIAIARLLSKHDLSGPLALAVSRGNLHGAPPAAWAFGSAAIVGASIAILVALVTRHVTRAFALAIFGAIFAPVLWLGVHVLALRHHAWLVTEALPIGPMIVGTAVYGALLALIVPIRGR